MKAATTVDAYIAAFPEDVQEHLRRLRAAIRQAAPEARETISYRMPYYSHNGRLAYFAGFKGHIGLYIPPPVIQEHKKALNGYVTARATVRFPLDRPVPVRLVKRLIRARLELNMHKQK